MSETARFWDRTLPPDRRAAFGWPRLLDAPVVAVVFADPQAYVDALPRARQGRSRSDVAALGESTDAWPAPYWTIDAAMATMTLLLAAEDCGLGALFFGVFHDEDALRHELGVPDHVELLGALALGWPLEDDRRRGRSAARARTPRPPRSSTAAAGEQRLRRRQRQDGPASCARRPSGVSWGAWQA